VLLIVKQTTQLIQRNDGNKPFYSVKKILQDNWSNYLKNNKIRNIEKKEVEKMLSCKNIKRRMFSLFLYGLCKICFDNFWM